LTQNRQWTLLRFAQAQHYRAALESRAIQKLNHKSETVRIGPRGLRPLQNTIVVEKAEQVPFLAVNWHLLNGVSVEWSYKLVQRNSSAHTVKLVFLSGKVAGPIPSRSLFGDDYAGSVTRNDVWTTNTPPSRKEQGDLRALHPQCYRWVAHDECNSWPAMTNQYPVCKVRSLRLSEVCCETRD
jgi:hypothetical protein